MKKICYIVTLPITIRAFFIPQLKFLATNGFSITVICSPDSKLQNELGCTVKYIPLNIPRGVSIFRSASAINKLCKVFRKENYDLIQYSTPNAAFCASIAALISGCKIRNYHLMGFRYLGATGVGRILLKCIERITCRCSTSIECVSRSNLKIGVREKIFQLEKATVVWNGSSGGIDLNRFDIKKRAEYRLEIRNRYNLGDSYVYGFVGRITRDKGINELLEAFLQIEDGILMLIGNLEAIDTIDDELYQCSLKNERIKYVGSVDEIEKYYAALDILILPSYREGFGNVVIEAAAMGTPAIVSNIPGPTDAIVKGKTALVVPVKDSQQLAQCMKDIRKPKYTQLGNNAVKYVTANFDSRELNRHILMRKKNLVD